MKQSKFLTLFIPMALSGWPAQGPVCDRQLVATKKNQRRMIGGIVDL